MVRGRGFRANIPPRPSVTSRLSPPSKGLTVYRRRTGLLGPPRLRTGGDRRLQPAAARIRPRLCADRGLFRESEIRWRWRRYRPRLRSKVPAVPRPRRYGAVSAAALPARPARRRHRPPRRYPFRSARASPRNTDRPARVRGRSPAPRRPRAPDRGWRTIATLRAHRQAPRPRPALRVRPQYRLSLIHI